MTLRHRPVSGLALAPPSAGRDSPPAIDHAGLQDAARIAGWLQRELAPRGVGVAVEAEHLCMSLRGVQKLGATTVTSALHGLIRDDPRTRQEFLALATRTTP
jgi:hypothetical protein